MIGKQYKLAWGFLRERVGKLWLILLGTFCAVFLVSGLIFASIGEDSLLAMGKMLVDDNSVFGEEITTWYDYFLHNGESNLISVVVGIVPFVPVPLFILLGNAVMWGSAAGVTAQFAGCSLLKTIAFAMLPHCVLEVPANSLSEAMGILLFLTVTKKILKKSGEPLKPLLLNCLRVYILFVLPLLLLAGIVEAEITPILVGML